MNHAADDDDAFIRHISIRVRDQFTYLVCIFYATRMELSELLTTADADADADFKGMFRLTLR